MKLFSSIRCIKKIILFFAVFGLMTTQTLSIKKNYAYSIQQDFFSWNVKRVGNNVIYTPRNMKQGERFNITLFKTEYIHNISHVNWFEKFVDKDKNNIGKISYSGKISQEKLGVIVIVKKFSNVIGKEWDVLANSYKPKFESQFAFYLSKKIDNNKVSMIRVNYSNMEIMNRYKYGIKKVGEIMRSKGNIDYLEQKLSTYNKHKKSLLEAKKEKTAKEKRKDIAEKKAKAQRRTEPNKGLKLSQIEAVLIDNDIDVMIGGFDTTIYLLLKDKWVYKLGAGGEEIPPSDFDAKYSKKYEPDRWYKWRKNSKGKYEKKTKKRGWIEINGDNGIKGGVNETIDGYYGKHVGSSNFGSSSSYVRLFKNGRFELSSNSLVSSHVLDPRQSIRYTYSDKEGSKTSYSSSNKVTVVSLPGPNVVIGINSQKKDGAKNRGTYKINGYTIEMLYDDDRIKRKFFFFGPFNKSSIVIGNSYYWTNKDKKSKK